MSLYEIGSAVLRGATAERSAGSAVATTLKHNKTGKKRKWPQVWAIFLARMNISAHL
jgi:hypothetical protein